MLSTRVMLSGKAEDTEFVNALILDANIFNDDFRSLLFRSEKMAGLGLVFNC